MEAWQLNVFLETGKICRKTITAPPPPPPPPRTTTIDKDEDGKKKKGIEKFFDGNRRIGQRETNNEKQN